jgi:GNAT superfamily N-acetyltransferase
MNVAVVRSDSHQDVLKSIAASDLTLEFAKTYEAAFAEGDWNEKNDPKELLTTWGEQISSNGHTFVECLRDNSVVGGGAFAPLSSFPEKMGLLPSICHGSAYINEVWVAPEHQGKQVGRFILVNLEQLILAAGFKQISLWTHYTSKRLNKFYSVNGYQDVGDVDPIDGGIRRKVFYRDLNTATRALEPDS